MTTKIYRREPFRIVTLDGGGIRGLLTAVLIKRLDAEVPKFLDKASVIAGTSTGGILALGIAFGLTIEQLIALYRDGGPTIFAESWLDKLTHIDELCSPNFDSSRLRSVLEETFKDTRLGDLKRRVLITTFDLQRWKFKVMDSACAADKDVTLVDAALRTSAAPTYFRSHQGYVDGGVVANNPAMVGLTQALDEGCRPEDVALLSIGTGRPPAKPFPFEFNPDGSPKPLEWGLIQWAPRLMSILLDGGTEEIEFYVSRILNGSSHRLNPALNHAIDLADVSKIPELLNAADIADIEPTVNWLKANW